MAWRAGESQSLFSGHLAPPAPYLGKPKGLSCTALSWLSTFFPLWVWESMETVLFSFCLASTFLPLSFLLCRAQGGSSCLPKK